jgi:GntR family transcriptional regulator/MocR family aminotransferase
MPAAKIQSRGHFSISRRRGESLSGQIVWHVQDAIQSGRLVAGALLPSSRALARTLRVSRNTVLAAYDELKARGTIHGRRGAGMRVAGAGARAFDIRRLAREAQYPFRTISATDPDGNPVRFVY